ncbi:MAG: DUF6599 family protein [Desulfatibacillaceae bacterium]
MAQKRAPGKREKASSIAVLAVLAVIAAGVLLKQSFYDPEPYRPPGPTGEPARASSAAPTGPAPLLCAPQGASALGEAEVFSADNLSDKINGKAELYLSAGFRSLAARRFSLPGTDGAWVEVFLYDMGDPYGAFAVYSAQKRGGSASLDVPGRGYLTENGYCLARGGHYVEAVASAAGPDVMETMARAASACAENLPGGAKLAELSAFPEKGLDEDEITLLASDAFGFSELSNVFLARYERDGTEVYAFVSRRDTPDAARRLAESYHSFLLANGADDVALEEMEDARAADLFGILEIMFTRGPWLAGVHQAEDREAAVAVARDLAQSLEQEQP